jgi:hypothetical protein
VVNAEKQEDVFPKKPPMNRIAAKALACYPNITLRPNEHTTLSDAAFSLVRRALMTAKDKNLFVGQKIFFTYECSKLFSEPWKKRTTTTTTAVMDNMNSTLPTMQI